MKLRDLLEEVEVNEGLLDKAKGALGMKTDADKKAEAEAAAEAKKMEKIDELIGSLTQALSLKGSRDYTLPELISMKLKSIKNDLQSLGIKVDPPKIGHDGQMMGGKEYGVAELKKIISQLQAMKK
jgi:hypothetical protein